ncbi:MAG: hypothetical protein ACJAZ9_001474 [Neolewinella sp.]|jgi:hypothetical protein
MSLVELIKSNPNDLPEQLTSLLASGVDPNGAPTEYPTPIALAATYNRLDAVKILIDAKANVDVLGRCLVGSVVIVHGMMKAAGSLFPEERFGMARTWWRMKERSF